MNPFAYSRVVDPNEAVSAIAANPLGKFLGGGTNLVDLMKMGVETPTQLIDINRLPLARVEELPAGKGVRIGALARNSDVAAHELIKSRYPVLSEAFLSGEVELLYQRAEWDRQAYEEFFDGARQRLEARYGRGTVL